MDRPTLDQLYNPSGISPVTTQTPQQTGASAYSASVVPTGVTQSERPSLDQLYSPEKLSTPTPTQNISQETSMAQDIGTGIRDTFVTPFTERFNRIDYNNQGALSNVLQSVGAVAGGVTDVVGKALIEGTKVFLPQSVESTVGDAATKVGSAISGAIPDELKVWAEAHPEAAANLGSIVDIASIIPIGKAAGLAKTAVKAGDGASLLAKAETAAQRIVQPSKPELFSAKDAVKSLQSIDTNGIKTYSSLRDTLRAKNTTDLTEVTSQLLKDTTRYGVEGFDINKSGLKFNPVKDAISSLKELGTKTADTDLLAELKPFEDKLLAGAMTSNDVNELAKIVGRKQNAFKASGEILKRTNAVKAENTRKALKEIARKNMPEDVKNLDKSVSDRILLTNRMDNISNAVGRELQRAKDLSLFEKGTKLTAQAIDIATGRILSTSLNQLKNTSRLTAVEVEKELAKNLKIIQDINKLKDAKKMEQFLKSIGYFSASQAANEVNAPSN